MNSPFSRWTAGLSDSTRYVSAATQIGASDFWWHFFFVEYASDSQLEDETEPSKHGYDAAKDIWIEHLSAHFSQMYVLDFYADIFIYKMHFAYSPLVNFTISSSLSRLCITDEHLLHKLNHCKARPRFAFFTLFYRYSPLKQSEVKCFALMMAAHESPFSGVDVPVAL